MKVDCGKKVKLHYVGKLEDGSVFDQSLGREPLEFVVCSGQVIPGFDEGVKGMEIGEKKTIFINMLDGYGEYREDLTMEVPKTNIPNNPYVGMQLQTEVGNTPIPVHVKEIRDTTVIIDANHPLSGKNLIFDLEIIGIE
jgi:FKBP-type peptidyl-prolyl cis-trans isomerase 2